MTPEKAQELVDIAQAEADRTPTRFHTHVGFVAVCDAEDVGTVATYWDGNDWRFLGHEGLASRYVHKEWKNFKDRRTAWLALVDYLRPFTNCEGWDDHE